MLRPPHGVLSSGVANSMRVDRYIFASDTLKVTNPKDQAQDVSMITVNSDF
jgi:hypothetical protein